MTRRIVVAGLVFGAAALSIRRIRALKADVDVLQRVDTASVLTPADSKTR